MNHQKRLLFIAILNTLLLFSACVSESETKPELLLGRWEIQEATRNGRETESLSELYYEFRPDQIMLTNLQGFTEEGTYEVEEDRLKQKEMQLKATYSIESLNDSILVMTTELRDYRFRFILKKAVREE